MRLAKIKAGCKAKRKDGGRISGDGAPKRMDRPCRADGGGVKDYMRDNKIGAAGSAGIHAAMGVPAAGIAVIDPDPITKAAFGTMAGVAGAKALSDLKQSRNFAKGEKMWGKTGMPDRPSEDERRAARENKAQSMGRAFGGAVNRKSSGRAAKK